MLLRGCGQWFRCGRERVTRPSEHAKHANLDLRPQRHRRRQEDVSKGEPSRRQTSLHSRSSDLTSELQSSVRSDEVVLALFTVGDVYASLCKRGAYAPFSAQRRSRALFWL